ncbi:hypothetical protein [Flectobacillus rivi]|uniref:DUF676 domain-containing protein n=1 Tax=Flectobacillus rivi TaxID=2984209 RepID=A0ABT6Z515_9BACT|nr:hypothetical protein [Flectobacillus rivi]MDI9876197.1 hypothetical protein [Flectobacillus rivi]
MKTSKFESNKCIAVISIHGMGEQSPMDTLRGLVQSLKGDGVLLNQPDTVSKSYELRRYSYFEDLSKYDFYEYYWANLIQEKGIWNVIRWLKYLLCKKFSEVPKRLRIPYFFIWIAILVGIAYLGDLAYSISSVFEIDNACNLKFLGIESVKLIPFLFFIIILVSLLVTSKLNLYFGDVVNYTIPAKNNINEREAIRKKGITLFKSIIDRQNPNGSPYYDKVVVLAHSLGTIIAYDILKIIWAERHDKISLHDATELIKFDNLSREALKNQDVSQYQQLQDKLRDILLAQNIQKCWNVSDFITLGSPLSHASYLLVDSHNIFNERVTELEFPTSPPSPSVDSEGSFYYLSDNTQTSHEPDSPSYVLNHGALFALTKWTNIYFKQDFVGGAIDCFGKGIRNIELHPVGIKTRYVPFYAHTSYWDTNQAASVNLLKSILGLTTSRANQ